MVEAKIFDLEKRWGKGAYSTLAGVKGKRSLTNYLVASSTFRGCTERYSLEWRFSSQLESPHCVGSPSAHLTWLLVQAALLQAHNASPRCQIAISVSPWTNQNQNCFAPFLAFSGSRYEKWQFQIVESDPSIGWLNNEKVPVKRMTKKCIQGDMDATHYWNASWECHPCLGSAQRNELSRRSVSLHTDSQDKQGIWMRWWK